MDKLINKNALLQQCAEQLAKNVRASIGTVEVVLRKHASDEGYTFGLVEFVDAMANDLFWDERGNWSDCTLLELRTI